MNIKAVINEYVSGYLKKEKLYSQIGIVSEINEIERSCIVTPINGDSERKARLQVSLNMADGIFVKPKDGSYVLFTYLNRETGVIICFSQVDSIYLDVENDIIINGGTNGGLVKISSLIEKINILENSVNDLKNAITSWTPVIGDGGSALKTTLLTWIGSLIDLSVVSDLENEKIKQ